MPTSPAAVVLPYSDYSREGNAASSQNAGVVLGQALCPVNVCFAIRSGLGFSYSTRCMFVKIDDKRHVGVGYQ